MIPLSAQKHILPPFGVVAKWHHHQTTGPPPKRISPFMSVNRLHGLLEFEADPFSTKKDLFTFGLVAKWHHHQTTAPLPSAFTQLMCVDMLHGLMKFGADPFCLEKNKFSFVSVWLQTGAITKQRVQRQAHSPCVCAWTCCTAS